MQEFAGSLYDVLGVPESASAVQIQEAFEIQIRAFAAHRLANLAESEVDAHRRQLTQLHAAYLTLRDPHLRASYDWSRAPQPTPDEPALAHPAPPPATEPQRPEQSIVSRPSIDPAARNVLVIGATVILAVLVIAISYSMTGTRGTKAVPPATVLSPAVSQPVTPGDAPPDLPAMLRRSPKDVAVWRRLQAAWGSASDTRALAEGVGGIVNLLEGRSAGAPDARILAALQQAGHLAPDLYAELADTATKESLETGQAILRLGLRQWPNDDLLRGRLASSMTALADPRVSSFTLRADQPGASVYLSGRQVGVTDSRGMLELADVPLGSHQLAVRKEGFTDGRRILEVGAAMSSIEVSLVPKPAALILSSPDAGLTVTIDGRSTQDQRIELTPGVHTLTVSKPGHRSLSRQFTLNPGQELSLNIALEPVPAERGERAPRSTALGSFDSLIERNDVLRAADTLVAAINGGAEPEFRVLHHHRNLTGQSFCAGTLRFSQRTIGYSGTERKHSFSVAWDSVTEINDQRFESGQSTTVAFQLKGRLSSDDDRTMNFFTPEARLSQRGTIECGDCKPRMYAYVMAARRLRDSSVRPQGTPALQQSTTAFQPGIYSGRASDSTGPGEMTLSLSQIGGVVNGAVSGRSTRGSANNFKGQFSGTFTPPGIAFTIEIPPGGISAYPDCAVHMTGTIHRITPTILEGRYSGTTSCGPPFSKGSFKLEKR